ncbi:hypothetical protein OE88DRAFT_1659528 [Heliocybe sulcata]|uniref:Nudix hydrolase domain-containing protein n=1 Tax=Heliocybe sulcata TaxID=5364 RepID=A0A5C3N218_9AGAM|nr:hypothetical protein OE88DRAFT_1659528 [Heliocybe sulcata]
MDRPGVRVSPEVQNRLIPAKSFLASPEGHGYHRLVVGVAIFHPRPGDDQPKLLIVKRSAQERFLPNVWEIPGGHVDPDDGTIIDAVVREAQEETALTVSEVMGEFEHFVYTVPAEGDGGAEERTTIQLNFAVEVQDATVVLSDRKHQDHAWVSADDLGGYALTEGMEKVVRDAFQWAEQRRSGLEDIGIEGTDKVQYVQIQRAIW